MTSVTINETSSCDNHNESKKRTRSNSFVADNEGGNGISNRKEDVSARSTPPKRQEQSTDSSNNNGKITTTTTVDEVNSNVDNTSDNVVNDVANSSNESMVAARTGKAVPAYGSQEYWEQRYVKQFQELHSMSGLNQPPNNHVTKNGSIDINNIDLDNKVIEKSEDSESVVPYHSWYFDYSELRPIILPILLGGREEVYQLIAENCDGNDDDDSHMNTSDNEYHDSIDHDDDDNHSHNNASENEDHDSIANDDENNNALDNELHDSIDNDDVGVNGSDAKKYESTSKNDSADENDTNKKDNNADEKQEENNGGDEEDDDDEKSNESHEHEHEEGDEYEEVEYEEVEYEEVECDDDDPSRNRDGLADNGPINVLEIGCGDVPLGVGLANELRQLQLTTGSPSNKIVRQILCTDYSPTLIDIMKQQFSRYDKNSMKCDAHIEDDVHSNSNKNCGSNDNGNGIPPNNIHSSNNVNLSDDVSALYFEVADARSFPYQNGTFEFIMEKGTLDAMLSDPECGVSNCKQMVSECARLLTPKTKTIHRVVDNEESTTATVTNSTSSTKPPSLVDGTEGSNGNEEANESHPSPSNAETGCLLIVSHLNAHSAAGLKWLHEVVIGGLLQGAKDDNVEFEIEVHGNESPLSDDVDDNNKVKKQETNLNSIYDSVVGEDDDHIGGEMLGPAVYVIHKRFRKIKPTESTSTANAENGDVVTKDDEEKGRGIPIKFFAY